MEKRKRNYLMDGDIMESEKIKIEHVKKVIAIAKETLKRLHHKIKNRMIVRNMLLRRRIKLRDEDNRAKREIAKLDTEIHKMYIELGENQKVINEAKKFGFF
jgi:hypothetical protein